MINLTRGVYTAQKMKFFIKDFFSKIDQIRKKLQIWSYLVKKSITENFIFQPYELEQNAAAILFWLLPSQMPDTTTKNFAKKIVISGSVSTMQRCIVNNISQNKQVWMKARRH